MDFRFIDDEYVWNIPLARSGNAQFLQSWEWGIFQQTLGRPAHRVQIIEDEKVMAALQLYEYTLPFGRKYLYASRGPVILTNDSDALGTIMHLMRRVCRDLADESGAVFTRLEPVEFYSNILQNVGMSGRGEEGRERLLEESKALNVKLGHSVQPKNELAVLVEKEEDILLSAMHEKTRYNIRLAEKHGVRARLIEQLDYSRRVFPFFWNLLQETAERQHIHTYPRSYFEQLLTVLLPRGVAKLHIAEHNNIIIAAHLLTVFGDTVYYLHGGSSHKHRALMAPHLLHWEGVRLAKRLGKAFYNLGGVAPVGAGSHAWANLSRFKEGFVREGETGIHLSYIGGFDLVFSPLWYTMYTAARRTRQLTRFR